MSRINTIIFDLGGVLVDWNPNYVYHKNYFLTKEQKDYFFNNICTSDWNENQDAGYSLKKATEEKLVEFPDWKNSIQDFYGKWEEMLGGPMHDTVEIFRQLKQNQQLKFYALTNWSAETFPIALKRFDFLHWFDGRVVSGEEKTRKPFPEFFQLLFDRYQIDPTTSIFIDDNLRNINAGNALGLKGICFTDSKQLKEELKKYGLL